MEQYQKVVGKSFDDMSDLIQMQDPKYQLPALRPPCQVSQIPLEWFLNVID